jgi:prepilin-type processing-associated H-X9-DG protein
MSCSNNLHQLGMAVLNSENSKKKFPQAGLVGPPGNIVDVRSGPMISWIVTVLPYMENSSLFKTFDLKKSILEQTGDPQATQLEALMCPDDWPLGRYYSDPSFTGGKRFAKGNYAAFCSPFHVELQLAYPGAMIVTGQTAEKVRDGLAHTLMLSEVRTRSQTQDQRGVWALPWNGSSLLAFDMHAASTYKSRFDGSPYSLGETQPPNNRGPNVDMLYACPDIDDAQMRNMPCGLWQAGTMYDFLSAAPRSLHPGGVNATYMDGHAVFLRNEIDENTMAYLIHVNDGHPAILNQ